MTNTYELTDVQHRYGSRCVVDVASLQVRAGEILCIVGPSGAGKSTLLRLLNFLESPTHGRVAYKGTKVGADVPLPLRREVVTVFQHPMLLRRSVAANVRIGQRIRGVEPTDGNLKGWLDRLGLADLSHVQARTLSAGEAQRVALARALVVEPSVLLLDEPTGNLDPYNVGLIEDIVQSENTQRGTTIVLVTHDIFQARRLAHRTGLMIGGQILEMADTEAFFSAPERPETAAFLRGDLVHRAVPAVATPSRRRRPSK
ncbi:MAG: ATP-binding cassette domain-containing protein [Acidimicrobiia bacterium]|nr:ATP-binding cassette domain-containing protein [Acidimicrobiia bacterium]